MNVINVNNVIIFIGCCSVAYPNLEISNPKITVIENFQNYAQQHNNRNITGSFIDNNGETKNIVQVHMDKPNNPDEGGQYWYDKGGLFYYANIPTRMIAGGFGYMLDPGTWNMEDNAPIIRLNFSRISCPFKGAITWISKANRAYKTVVHQFTPDNLNPTISIFDEGIVDDDNVETPNLKEVKYIGFDLNWYRAYTHGLNFCLNSIETLPANYYKYTQLPSGVNSSDKVSTDHREKVEIEVVPEPCSFLILGSGLTGFIRKKKFKKIAF